MKGGYQRDVRRAGSAPDLGSLPGSDSAPEAARETPALPEGHIIASKYRIERVLGRGGMGVVYAARHLALDEPVAIKVLLPAMMELPGMVARFMREARAASKIKSVHVARVTDVDTLPSGIPYMVMEYLEGIDLSMLRSTRGPLPIQEAAHYIMQACDALAEAHKLGIIHRDIKPSNLFLARHRNGGGVIKVLDFGISKVESPGGEDTTKTGILLGSPRYMSPEQMKSMRDADGRADIWSLGVILYELLAGRTPFAADSMAQVCARVLHGEPTSLGLLRPDVPPVLESIVMRCLEKDPEARFSTAEELLRALAPFAGASARSARTSAWPRSSADMAPPPSARGERSSPSADTPLPLGAPDERPRLRGAAPLDIPVSAVSAPGALTEGALPARSSSPTGTLAMWNALAPASGPTRRRRGFAAAVALGAAVGGGGLLLAQRGGGPSTSTPAAPAEHLVAEPTTAVVSARPHPPAPAVPAQAVPTVPAQADPESAQAAPESAQAAPESVQAAPPSAQAAPESAQAAPESVQAAPPSAQAALAAASALGAAPLPRGTSSAGTPGPAPAASIERADAVRVERAAADRSSRPAPAPRRRVVDPFGGSRQ